MKYRNKETKKEINKLQSEIKKEIKQEKKENDERLYNSIKINNDKKSWTKIKNTIKPSLPKDYPILYHNNIKAITTKDKTMMLGTTMEEIFCSKNQPQLQSDFERQTNNFSNMNLSLFEEQLNPSFNDNRTKYTNEITKGEIEDIISNLDIHEAAGHDSINNRCIKNVTESISPTLTLLFNKAWTMDIIQTNGRMPKSL